MKFSESTVFILWILVLGIAYTCLKGKLMFSWSRFSSGITNKSFNLFIWLFFSASLKVYYSCNRTKKTIENITYEHLGNLLPVMRVSCLAAHQLKETSLLMPSFSFRCERGKFFWVNLLPLRISVMFPLGLSLGRGGGHWDVWGCFPQAGHACKNCFENMPLLSACLIMTPHAASYNPIRLEWAQIILIQCGIPYVFLCK